MKLIPPQFTALLPCRTLLLFLVSFGFPTVISHAAFTTNITSDGTLPTPSAVNPAGKVYNVDGGTVRGNNLFHSFRFFSVGTGDSASFNAPAGTSGILNILSRVTGGQQSQIDGTIKSTITGANLYLMNPAGVLFGSNAKLNLSGSFHVTTADYLRLTDSVRFNAVPDAAKDNLLTTAPAAAFGFLSTTPGPLSVQGSILEVPEAPGNQVLSFIGGNIDISNALLRARHGQVRLASVASPGEVIPNNIGLTPALDVSSFAALGKVSLSGSTLSTNSTLGGGTVIIRAGQLLLNSAAIVSGTFGSANGASSGVDIQTTQTMSLTNGSVIEADAFGAGKAGSVQVSTHDLTISNSDIGSFSEGPGDGGDLTINTGSFVINPHSFIGANSLFGAGKGGNVDVTADTVLITGVQKSNDPFGADFTGITTISGINGKNGGHLRLTANSVIITTQGSIAAGSLGAGNSGIIEINARDVQVLEGANISSSARGSGNGGDITVNADNVIVSGVNSQPYVDRSDPRHTLVASPSAVVSQVGFDGSPSQTGGNIRITAKTLTVSDGGKILTNTFGAGQSGNIDVTADHLVMSGSNELVRNLQISQGLTPDQARPEILAETENDFGVDIGNAGNIRIHAGTVELQDGAAISNRTTGSGLGGIIALSGNTILLTNDVAIVSVSLGSGTAGDIQITVTDKFVSRNSAVTAGTVDADGGNIVFLVGNLVHLINSTISTSVHSGAGGGGNIFVDPKFLILDHSQIVANAFLGRGGNVTLSSNVFLVDPFSMISASSALGINGTVDIQSPIQNLSGTLSPLPASLLKIAPLTAACAARVQGGKFSSFTVAGRDGVPAEPGGLLPSPLQQAGQSFTGSAYASSDDPGLPVPILLSLNLEGGCGP